VEERKYIGVVTITIQREGCIFAANVVMANGRIGGGKCIMQRGCAYYDTSSSCYLFFKIYLTSSKSTLTDYQCVSTGCCIHVAKTEITIDNQHVTKLLQRYTFLPKQPKENTKKITNLMIFLDFLDSDGLYMEEGRQLFP
jgi:hypothetical protein